MKAYVPALEFHIDSLNLEIKNLYEVQGTLFALVEEKQTHINLLLDNQVLDSKTISGLKRQLKRRKRKFLLIIPAAAVGYLAGRAME